MNLKNRLAKIEAGAPKDGKVHFLGWADCEWREAEGLVRGENESREDFFSRVQAITDNKFIWCN
jgi:hypothetical protein